MGMGCSSKANQAPQPQSPACAPEKETKPYRVGRDYGGAMMSPGPNNMMQQQNHPMMSPGPNNMMMAPAMNMSPQMAPQHAPQPLAQPMHYEQPMAPQQPMYQQAPAPAPQNIV